MTPANFSPPWWTLAGNNLPANCDNGASL